jgi:hypothetical protein
MCSGCQMSSLRPRHTNAFFILFKHRAASPGSLTHKGRNTERGVKYDPGLRTLVLLHLLLQLSLFTFLAIRFFLQLSLYTYTLLPIRYLIIIRQACPTTIKIEVRSEAETGVEEVVVPATRAVEEDLVVEEEDEEADGAAAEAGAGGI